MPTYVAGSNSGNATDRPVTSSWGFLPEGTPGGGRASPGGWEGETYPI